MRGNLDFSSWHALFNTLFGLILVSGLAVGLRLVMMQTVQRRRERQNRQINERLKTLIAAYKTLGGSFTGNLSVSPMHLKDLASGSLDEANGESPASSSERARRTRDAVEAALSDIILLGTQEQVELAAKAAGDMVAGQAVQVETLVVSLRSFIREALDLAPVPASIRIPAQGPLRPSAQRAGARSSKESPAAANKNPSGAGMGQAMGNPAFGEELAAQEPHIGQ